MVGGIFGLIALPNKITVDEVLSIVMTAIEPVMVTLAAPLDPFSPPEPPALVETQTLAMSLARLPPISRLTSPMRFVNSSIFVEGREWCQFQRFHDQGIGDFGRDRKIIAHQ